MDLAGELGLGDRALVAFVGAGGKKTAMAHLTETATEQGRRAGYTTTTHMPPPDYPLVLTDTPSEGLGSVDTPVAFAHERVPNPERATRKVRGHDPGTIGRLFEQDAFDWLLVKADGARRRECKAPGDDEPVIPARSTHVVPVVSVTAIGKPLDEQTVHRPDRVAALTDLDVGERLTPTAIGAVLAHPEGGCKSVPEGAAVTPLVNKADDAGRQETARAVLDAALTRTDRFDCGLVCSFESDVLSVRK